MKKTITATALAAGGFGAGKATQPAEYFMKAPLDAANYEQLVEQACRELDERTWLVKCKVDGKETAE